MSHFLNKSLVLILVCLIGTARLFASGPVDAYVASDTTLSESRNLLTKFAAPLSDEQEQACLSFLKHRFSEDTLASGRVRQNNLADWLLQRPEHVNTTTQVLLEVIHDESFEDLLWREFCVQKLSLAVLQEALSKPLEADCYEALEQMSADARISFAGTALLGLYRLHVADPVMLPGERILPLAKND